jgi:hypothetical protein
VDGGEVALKSEPVVAVRSEVGLGQWRGGLWAPPGFDICWEPQCHRSIYDFYSYDDGLFVFFLGLNLDMRLNA